MGQELVRYHVFFTGRVQGVFFRANTKNKAVELGLSGWVRNLFDGRVEAVFEGPADKINSIITWCKHSIPHAKVITVEMRTEEPERLQDFLILR